jgi:Cof subfamily protein (haloacid dehalogenase superfamily)
MRWVIEMKKLFFFDIDGTLIDYPSGLTTISNQTIESLNLLKSQGHSVFLATGRCKCFILDEVMKYPFDGYVTCNGGYVEYKNEVIYKNIIPAEAIKITHELCLKNNWLYYFESSDNIYVLDKNNEKHVHFRDNWGMKPHTIIDDYDFHKIETYIGMIVVNNENDVEVLKETLSPYFSIQRHMHGYSFDLTLKGESKGNGIKKLVEGLNLDLNDTVAFGDGRNDLEMIETVGLGIAMGNGAQELKDVSDYMTKTVLDEGIAYALKKFSFI